MFEVVAAPATPVTAARRPRESPPLLGVLLELVGGPRRRRVTCRAGVWEGSAARMARSSFRIEAKDGLRSRRDRERHRDRDRDMHRHRDRDGGRKRDRDRQHAS